MKKKGANAGRKSARAILSKGSPKVGPPFRVYEWLKARPEAFEFAKTFIEMKDRGETNWSCKMAVDHLRAEFGYPFRDDSRFVSAFKRGASHDEG